MDRFKEIVLYLFLSMEEIVEFLMHIVISVAPNLLRQDMKKCNARVLNVVENKVDIIQKTMDSRICHLNRRTNKF